MNRTLNVATSVAASIARLGGGLRVGTLGRRPKQRLELYEFEACPYCRKGPRGALRRSTSTPWSTRARRTGRASARGRAARRQGAIPVSRRSQHGHRAVRVGRHRHVPVRPVRRRCGAAAAPSRAAHRRAARWSPARWRPAFGARYQPATPPAKPLELYSFEASPFCRIVRERSVRARDPLPPAQCRQGQSGARRVRQAIWER